MSATILGQQNISSEHRDKAQMERGQLLLVTDTLTTKDGSRAFSNGTGKGALFEKNATLSEVALGYEIFLNQKSLNMSFSQIIRFSYNNVVSLEN